MYMCAPHATIRASSGNECDGKVPAQVQSRVDDYTGITATPGVTSGPNSHR